MLRKLACQPRAIDGGKTPFSCILTPRAFGKNDENVGKHGTFSFLPKALSETRTSRRLVRRPADRLPPQSGACASARARPASHLGLRQCRRRIGTVTTET